MKQTDQEFGCSLCVFVPDLSLQSSSHDCPIVRLESIHSDNGTPMTAALEALEAKGKELEGQHAKVPAGQQGAKEESCVGNFLF